MRSSRTAPRGRRVWLTIALAVLAGVGTGCHGDDRDGERMFVEAQLEFPNAVTMNLYQRPIRVGLITGEEYTLTFTGEKFMSSVDGKMEMAVTLTEGLEDRGGDSAWVGTDMRGAIESTVLAAKAGESLMTGMATNLESGFRREAELVVRIGDEEAEIVQCVGTR